MNPAGGGIGAGCCGMVITSQATWGDNIWPSYIPGKWRVSGSRIMAGYNLGAVKPTVLTPPILDPPDLTFDWEPTTWESPDWESRVLGPRIL